MCRVTAARTMLASNSHEQGGKTIPHPKKTKIESTDGKKIPRQVGGCPRDVFTSKDYLMLAEVCCYTGGAVALYVREGLRKVDSGSNPEQTQLEVFFFFLPRRRKRARE